MNIIREPVFHQSFDPVCRPSALPHDRVIYRFSGMPVPYNRCFSLIRDSDRSNLSPRCTDLADRFRCNGELRCPDLHRIMFYPTGLRIDLLKFFLCHTADIALLVK